ncbi:aminotransferase class I/II-fold pyridoxal phosphate-dependent enzyme [Desulfovibrio sp. JC022]|uniref:aminotransferase class I/II-fold pyridoxal phosphate-dependent enzyme n=1 Tax=Desulfovibrio sp. JC022 TaxID=2593642 RepID=UPI0013D5F6D6|nr:aminotransferase class I/II-fold pyridoxal phosphate-dependent enzyme [Desulfovibrio sp. JC022]NDV22647.1 aminotransferase class I/II-fold pyridoxal phosphate-dependent enzyme [Desulfovibrio sp. JC022]
MTDDLQEDVALQHFVEQSLDKLDQIENVLIEMEKMTSPSPASVAQVYGILVSLKESASLLELTNISTIAGKIGQVLDQVFKNEIELSNDLLNIIIDSFDKLNEIVSNATLSEGYDIRIITLPLEMYSKPESAPAPKSSKPQKAAQPVAEPEPAPQPKPAPKPEPVAKTENVPAQEKQHTEEPAATAKSDTKLSPAAFRKKYGIKKDMDLASNANPLGVSKAVSNAIVNMANNCCAFENGSTDSLKFGLAKRHDVPEECVLMAGGAVEILDLALRLSAMPGSDHVLSYEHGMPEYSSVAALCGVELLRLPRGRNFTPPLDQLVTTANENTAAVIITNPDVPSGYGLPAEELATMCNLLPERTLLIVDERSVEFSWPEDDYSMVNFLEKAPNLVILRSFSWSFGLRGVRLGYALMSREKAQQFEESRLPTPISPLNVGAGLAALNHSEFYYSTIALIIRGRERVQKGLEELGCTVYPSQSNFIMFSSPMPAKELHGKMLEHGFKLRALADFGLPDLLTVSIGNNSRNRMFLAALKNIL